MGQSRKKNKTLKGFEKLIQVLLDECASFVTEERLNYEKELKPIRDKDELNPYYKNLKSQFDIIMADHGVKEGEQNYYERSKFKELIDSVIEAMQKYERIEYNKSIFSEMIRKYKQKQLGKNKKKEDDEE